MGKCQPNLPLRADRPNAGFALCRVTKMNDELSIRLRALCDAFALKVIDADAYETGLAKLRREYGPQAVDELLQRHPDVGDHVSPEASSHTTRPSSPPFDATHSVLRTALLPTLSADGVHFSYGHALLIGIADYADPRLRVAGGTTASDARALGALLRDPQAAAYPERQVRVLTDAKATRTAILDALEALAHEATDGAALVCFAGRGAMLGAGYGLLPYDADLTDLDATALTAELCQRRIDKLRARARQLVVLLNCCHGGGADAVAPGVGAAPPAAFYRPLAQGSGQLVICASRPEQQAGAVSRQDAQHTPFGAQLLAALRGAAPGNGPAIGVFELFAYLRATVPGDAPHLIQEPLCYTSQLADNLAIALRPGGQGGTRNAELDQQLHRLVALELALDATPARAALRAERDALLARLVPVPPGHA